MNTKHGYRYVIGLTGPIASGKGLVAKMILHQFQEREAVSTVLLSDYIRDVVRAQGQPVTRDTLREAGNTLRRERGPGAWVERMLRELPEDSNGVLLVDSIRNPGEIALLRQHFGDRVFVIATDAPMEERIERTLRRGREDDSTDTAEIERQMRIEMEDHPEFGFAIERARDMADVVSVAKDSKAERNAEIQTWIREFVNRVERNEATQEYQWREGKAA